MRDLTDRKTRKPIIKLKNQSEGKRRPDRETVNFVCVGCRENERIPLSVVRDFDDMDAGDLEVPLLFICGACGNNMYPEYYKGVHGYEYRIGMDFGTKMKLTFGR